MIPACMNQYNGSCYIKDHSLLLSRYVTNYLPLSDRVIMLQLNSHISTINITSGENKRRYDNNE